MPTYEYNCEHCGDFEEIQRITNPPRSRCPRCKSKVRRLISKTSFQLKGSGWYVTDYARAGGGNGAKKDGGKDSTASEGNSKAKSAGKSETKPASGGSGTKSASGQVGLPPVP